MKSQLTEQSTPYLALTHNTFEHRIALTDILGYYKTLSTLQTNFACRMLLYCTLAPTTNTFTLLFAYGTSDTSSTLISLNFAHLSFKTALLLNWNTLFYIASIVTSISLFQFSTVSYCKGPMQICIAKKTKHIHILRQFQFTSQYLSTFLK